MALDYKFYITCIHCVMFVSNTKVDYSKQVLQLGHVLLYCFILVVNKTSCFLPNQIHRWFCCCFPVFCCVKNEVHVVDFYLTWNKMYRDYMNLVDMALQNDSYVSFTDKQVINLNHNANAPTHKINNLKVFLLFLRALCNVSLEQYLCRLLQVCVQIITVTDPMYYITRNHKILLVTRVL